MERSELALALAAAAWLALAGGCDGSRPQRAPDGAPPGTGAADPRVGAAPPTATVALRQVGSARVAAAAGAKPSAAAAAPASSVEPEETPVVRRKVAQRRDRSTSGRHRTEAARKHKTSIVEGLFASAGVRFPPRQLLFRAFKKEGRLEVWAAAKAKEPLSHVTTYEVCYASGALGPKRREGDMQVPEGFYRVSWFKAKSDYHMAMQVSYPNTSDRILGHPREPGGEIMIHGDCVSIGCIAMSDDRIEELWVMGRAAPRVFVHVFPTRDMDGLLARGEQAEHHDFWRNIKVGFDKFERDHLVPGVRIKRDGRYSFF